MNRLPASVLMGLGCLALLVACQPETRSTAEEASLTHSMEDPHSSGHGEAHADHDPQHGGTFFMALDGIHHLEGALTEPDMFRVYIYDEFTEPLSSERISQARGTLHWGEFPDPPAMQMAVNAERSCLEVQLDGELDFPVVLTALIYLPGGASDAKPELFNFSFDHFSPVSD